MIHSSQGRSINFVEVLGPLLGSRLKYPMDIQASANFLDSILVQKFVKLLSCWREQSCVFSVCAPEPLLKVLFCSLNTPLLLWPHALPVWPSIPHFSSLTFLFISSFCFSFCPFCIDCSPFLLQEVRPVWPISVFIARTIKPIFYLTAVFIVKSSLQCKRKVLGETNFPWNIFNIEKEESHQYHIINGVWTGLSK